MSMPAWIEPLASSGEQSDEVMSIVSAASPQAMAQMFLRSLSTGDGLRPRHSLISCAMAVAQTPCRSSNSGDVVIFTQTTSLLHIQMCAQSMRERAHKYKTMVIQYEQTFCKNVFPRYLDASQIHM